MTCCKYPPGKTLHRHWDANKESLLAYMEQTHLGVKGIVTNTDGDPVSGAEVYVSGINWNVTTTSDGEYWRLLVNGTYTIEAFGDAGRSGMVNVTVDGMETSIVDLILQ